MSRVWLVVLGLCVGGFLLLWCGVGEQDPSPATIGTILGLILLLVSVSVPGQAPTS